MINYLKTMDPICYFLLGVLLLGIIHFFSFSSSVVDTEPQLSKFRFSKLEAYSSLSIWIDNQTKKEYLVNDRGGMIEIEQKKEAIK